MAATVMSDHSIAMLQEEHHLTIPVVSAQWPAVMKEKWLTFAPILEINLRTIFYCDRIHVVLLLGLVEWLTRSADQRLCNYCQHCDQCCWRVSATGVLSRSYPVGDNGEDNLGLR